MTLSHRRTQLWGGMRIANSPVLGNLAWAWSTSVSKNSYNSLRLANIPLLKTFATKIATVICRILRFPKNLTIIAG